MNYHDSGVPPFQMYRMQFIKKSSLVMCTLIYIFRSNAQI